MVRRMPMALRVLALVLAFALASCAQAPTASASCGLDDAARARVTALVKRIVERGHAPGVVADIRCDGQPWLTLAAGKADVARDRAMKQDDLFRIYSMTKPITSVAVLMLADDGRLSIDDPVSKHLAEFANASVYLSEEGGVMKSEPLRRPLTVRDLLRHSAGIPYRAPLPHPVLKRYIERGIDHGSGERIVPTDGSAPVDSVADLSRRIAAVPLLHQPGERFTYGNATDVLGRLVEAVSGQRLGDFLDARLFRPLGMTDTRFQVPAEATARLTAAYAGPSQRQGNGSLINVQRVDDLPTSKLSLVDDPQASVFSQPRAIQFGGAGLVSTAADYQRFMRVLLGRGAAGPQTLLRTETLAEMTRNQLDAGARSTSALGPQGLGFGLGVALVLEPERAAIAAPKNVLFWGGAASTYFWVDPQRRISGVLMTQVFGGDVSPYFAHLMDTLYGAAVK